MENNNVPAGNSVPEDKKTLCGVLAILLWFGVHNFILGETYKGILKSILVLVGSWIFGIGGILAGVWSIIEGIKILNGTYEVAPDKWFAI